MLQLRVKLSLINLNIAFLVKSMENEDGEKDADSEVTELRLKVDSLKQELKDCRAELVKLQKQLQQSERLQKSTESYNEDLRKQVRLWKDNSCEGWDGIEF